MKTDNKSSETITVMNRAGGCLAAGDNKGRIRLYRYPCGLDRVSNDFGEGLLVKF